MVGPWKLLCALAERRKAQHAGAAAVLDNVCQCFDELVPPRQ
jgi:hypothetical protein